MSPITQGLGYNQHEGNERKLWRAGAGRCDFRISLHAGQAVSTSDQTAATIAYLVPVGTGNTIELFDGEDFVPRKIAYNYNQDERVYRGGVQTDLSVMTTTTVPYDLFIRWRGGKAESKLVAWATATTRAGSSAVTEYLDGSGLCLYEGRFVRADGGTGVVAGGRLDPYWLYVATLYPSASGQCEDSAAKRFVWNFYNPVDRILLRRESTASWTYTSATIRQANASTSNQVAIVTGVIGRPLRLTLAVVTSHDTAGNQADVGIGEDSTTAYVDGQFAQRTTTSSSSDADITSSYLYRTPGLGYHYYTWLEASSGAGTGTFYGLTGSMYRSGIGGSILA